MFKYNKNQNSFTQKEDNPLPSLVVSRLFIQSCSNFKRYFRYFFIRYSLFMRSNRQQLTLFYDNNKKLLSDLKIFSLEFLCVCVMKPTISENNNKKRQNNFCASFSSVFYHFLFHCLKDEPSKIISNDVDSNEFELNRKRE